ncbi:SRPBCC family protein [Microbacterium mangrovi]|uniref:SRPBCC family protein n=1 Tax=Microbacterium mangrovi TaxID=1348253 RepID=UPI0009DDD90B|nr:SRPBCC family protein [Microbacterium mangrovi]
MLSTVTAVTDVAAPIRVAYDRWTQFEDFPDFMRSVNSIEHIDDRTLRWDVQVGGTSRQFVAEIVDQVPDDHIEWTSLDEPLHHGRVDFEPIDADHTRVSLQMAWQPQSFIEKAGAAVAVDDAAVRRDLQNFKELVEQEGATGAGWRGEIHETDVLPPSDPSHGYGTVLEHPELGDPTDPDSPSHPGIR